MVLDTLTYGEGKFLDDGVESTALFLGDEIRRSRGRLLDSLKAAIEALVQLVRKPGQFPAERFETSLLSLARDFGQFAGRDGAERGFDQAIDDTYDEMWNDIKMIREKRAKMKKMKGMKGTH